MSNNEIEKLKKDLFSATKLNEKFPEYSMGSKNSNNNENLYKVDLSLIKDKNEGYISTIRFLPNIKLDYSLDSNYIKRKRHFIDVKEPRQFRRYFDSPYDNFNEPCPLSKLWRDLKNSKNAKLVENSNCIKLSTRFYSYVEIIEDKQRPDLVGKIMIFEFGPQIEKIIENQKAGLIDTPCNIFDPANGKDFVLIVKQSAGRTNWGDYTQSQFKTQSSALSIMHKDKFVKAPRVTYKELAQKKEFDVNSVDNKTWETLQNEYTFSSNVQDVVMDYIINGEHITNDDGSKSCLIDAFRPKKLTDKDLETITNITKLLTGQADASDFNTSGQPYIVDRSNSINENDFLTPQNVATTETKADEFANIETFNKEDVTDDNPFDDDGFGELEL